MVSKTAEADIQEMWEAGLKPTVADIVRLNAVALRRERCMRPDHAVFYMRRVAWCGGVALFEPTLLHEIWRDRARQVVTAELTETALILDAFICSKRDAHELPDPFDKVLIQSGAQAFLAQIGGATKGQVAAAVLYAREGFEWARGEYPAEKPDSDTAETLELTNDFSVSLGILRNGLAIGLGLTLDEALRMPRRAFEAMVRRKNAYDGAISRKDVEADADDDYLRTLDEITARLNKEGAESGK